MTDKEYIEWINKYGATIWGSAHHSNQKFQVQLGNKLGEEKDTIQEAIDSLRGVVDK